MIAQVSSLPIGVKPHNGSEVSQLLSSNASIWLASSKSQSSIYHGELVWGSWFYLWRILGILFMKLIQNSRGGPAMSLQGNIAPSHPVTYQVWGKEKGCLWLFSLLWILGSYLLDEPFVSIDRKSGPRYWDSKRAASNVEGSHPVRPWFIFDYEAYIDHMVSQEMELRKINQIPTSEEAAHEKRTKTRCA